MATVMFGPVVTTEAHLAFSGARTHSNNTAEMTAMIEALSFLGPHGPVPRRVLLTIRCMLLVFVWAQSKLVHMCSSRWHVNSNIGYGSPCNTCMVMVGISVTNVLTMPLHLAHSDSPLATTLPRAGFIITLTLLCVLMAVTTSARSWNDCSTFEQMQRHFLKIGVSVGFYCRVHCTVCAFVWPVVVCVFCSQLFPFRFLLPQSRDGQSLFIRFHRTKY